MAVGAVIKFVKTGFQALKMTGGAGKKAAVRGFKARAALKGNAFSKTAQLASRTGKSTAAFWMNGLDKSQRVAATTVGGVAGLAGYNVLNSRNA